MDKKVIMIGMLFGSTLDAYFPTFFGAGMFSISSVIGGAVGGIIGIFLTFKYLT